ncbi:MAG: hypothetical protein AB1430_00875 [Pseudomonadota bacterium]
MEFKGINAQWLRWVGAAVGASIVALAGCGGGDPVEAFRPTRIVAFGDEASVIAPSASASAVDARKYSVNAFALNASGVALSTYDCRSNALWIQSVASAFGLRFKACPNGDADTSATGLIYAAPKAKVADVKTQIDNFIAAEQPFSNSDIVTVMAGTYDVLEQYALHPATPETTLTEVVKQRGKDLAMQVNRVAVTGAPVIVVRMPSVGLTPYGVSQSDGGAMLNRLSAAFNNELQLNLINDGHLIGLVYGDSDIQFAVTNAAALGLTNAKEPSCLAARSATDKLDPSVLLGCTTETLVTEASKSATAYLWAGNVQLGPYGQSRLGSLAASRAINNPF